jgi:hypothetical protein
VSCVHPFGLAFEPLKDAHLMSAFGGPRNWVAVGPMSPHAEFAPSSFHLTGQRLKVQIGAAGAGVRLPPVEASEQT